MKMAEKRAHVDAVLRLGLSDSFTQDLEEMKELPETLVETQSITREQKPVAEQKASKEQLEDIRFFAFVKKADMKKIKEYVKSEFGTTFDNVSKEQATHVMDMLETKYGKLEPVEV